jgi:outer membrane lipoprotein carrier protein
MFKKIFTLLALILATTLFSQGIKVPVSFNGTFKQQVKNSKGKILKYRGVVYFNAPSETKWIYKYPTKKEVCSSGKNLVVIDHDLEQVSYYKINKGFDLSRVLHNARLYKGRTYTTKYENTLYTIILNKKGEIEQIAYKDNLDNIVNIIFTKIHYRNKPISSSKFICARPKGYDTIY